MNTRHNREPAGMFQIIKEFVAAMSVNGSVRTAGAPRQSARDWIIAAMFVAIACVPAAGAELRLLPARARLDGPHARQRFLVERIEPRAANDTASAKWAATGD
jgi:hypothetical protein